MGNLTIKSKINRETEVSPEKVNLYIPAEKCCVYEDEKLIYILKNPLFACLFPVSIKSSVKV